MLLYRAKGLPEDQIGLLAALRPCVSFPAGALWSYIADRNCWHRQILIAAIAVSTVFKLSQAVLQGPWMLGAAVLLCSATEAPATALVDAAVTADLAENPAHGDYGRVRLYGALGWGVAAALGGLALSRIGWPAVFGLHAALILMIFWPSCMVNFAPLQVHGQRGQAMHPSTDDDAKDRAALVGDADVAMIIAHPPTQLQTGWDLARNPEVLLFLATVTVMGYGVGSIESFLFLLLDELGGPPLLAGLTLTLTCIAEPIVFYFAERLLRVLGHNGSLHVIFIAFLVRLVCYATLPAWPSPWLVLPVELLHGFTFGLTWAVGTAWVAARAPPHLRATVQSAFQGCYLGLGSGVGSLIGGHIYRRHGATTVFWTAFSVLTCGWAVTTAARGAIVCLPKKKDLAKDSFREGKSRPHVGTPVEYSRLEMVEQG